jgi:RNA polymerase primary sigma factor
MQFTVSLEAPPTEDDSQTLMETIRDTSEAAPDLDLETNSLYQKLNEVLDTLTPEQAAIIKFSFGIDCDRALSSEEIAKKLNLTNTKVRLIRDQALKRLKHAKRSSILRQLFRS